MKYILLFIEFFKTGLLSVGGGLATLPFLREMSLHYGWFTLDTLSLMIAVSQSTPGPIGVNVATYVGYLQGGFWVACLTTFALVLPSVCIVLIISHLLDKFKNSEIVKGIFRGLKPAVVALIIIACIPLFQNVLIWNFKAFFFYLIFLLIYLKFKIHPILLIFMGAILGCFITF